MKPTCGPPARSYALLGEKNEALDRLEKAIQLGFGYREWLEHDAYFDSLHDHPQFRALLSSL